MSIFNPYLTRLIRNIQTTLKFIKTEKHIISTFLKLLMHKDNTKTNIKLNTDKPSSISLCFLITMKIVLSKMLWFI